MRKGNATPLFLLSIIFPGIGFLLSIRKIWNKQYQKIILLFAFWLGFTAFFFGGDILEYKNAFPITGKYTWNSYFYLVTNSFSEDRLILFPDNVVNSKPDIYALTLQFIISRFTDNERWFFGFVSLIYAFLFLKFINEVLVFSGINKTKPWRFFFACLLLIVPFYVGLTGVRFWTALFWFMLFTMKYIRTKQPLFIALAAVSILIHYTFMFPVGVLLIYRFLNISKAAKKVLVILSLIFFTISTTTGLLGYAGQALDLFEDSSVKTVASSYTDEDNLLEKQQDADTANWYVKVKQALVTYSFMGIFLLEFFGVFKWRTNKYLDSWYSLYVLFFCIASFTFGLGSLGRFMYIFFLLSVIRLLIVSSINYRNSYIKIVMYWLFPVMLIHVLVSFRAGFYYIDPLLFVGNPVVYFVVHSTQSLSEFLVGH